MADMDKEVKDELGLDLSDHVPSEFLERILG
jgi:hypothetical protein